MKKIISLFCFICFNFVLLAQSPSLDLRGTWDILDTRTNKSWRLSFDDLHKVDNFLGYTHYAALTDDFPFQQYTNYSAEEIERILDILDENPNLSFVAFYAPKTKQARFFGYRYTYIEGVEAGWFDAWDIFDVAQQKFLYSGQKLH